MHQTRQHEQYIDNTRLTDAADVERMHSAAACATLEDFLRSTSTLGSSDKENHSVESISSHSDEGHATFMSDSPPIDDTDVEPMHPQTKTMTFTRTETLSTDTDKTVTADMTRTVHTAATTKNGLYEHLPPTGILPQARPGPKLFPMSSDLPSTGLQQVQQWVATQASVPPPPTPPVSVTISRTQTDISTLPQGYSASYIRSHNPSKSATDSRCSRRSSKSTVVDALANFGNQMTGNLMSFADKCSQDAARREESMRKEAMRREESMRQDALEREKLALAREQMLAQKQKEEEERNIQRSKWQNRKLWKEKN